MLVDVVCSANGNDGKAWAKVQFFKGVAALYEMVGCQIRSSSAGTIQSANKLPIQLPSLADSVKLAVGTADQASNVFPTSIQVHCLK